MIEIRCTSGDVAYADDPESAVIAARTLMDDDFRARPYQGRTRSVTFWVDDEFVRGPVSEPDIWAAAGSFA